MPMSVRSEGKGEAQLRFRVVQNIVSELSSTGQLDLSTVPAAGHEGASRDAGRGIRSLLAEQAAGKKAEATAAAAEAVAPVAETAAEAEVRLSASGWKLPAPAKSAEVVVSRQTIYRCFWFLGLPKTDCL